MKNTGLNRSLLLLLLLFGLSSCGVSNVVIDGSFPTPNINKMPIAIAVYYDDALKDFAYLEYSETGQEEFNIESMRNYLARVRRDRQLALNGKYAAKSA